MAAKSQGVRDHRHERARVACRGSSDETVRKVRVRSLALGGAAIAELWVMSNRHELHAYNYVNRPYSEVRTGLVDLLTRASRAGEAVPLHATAGPLDLSTEIRLELLAVHESRDSPTRPTTMVEIGWKAIHRPKMFPTMRATFTAYPLSPTETQLELSGIYDPPLGVMGDAIDAVALGRIAKESVQRFVDEAASYLSTQS